MLNPLKWGNPRGCRSWPTKVQTALQHFRWGWGFSPLKCAEKTLGKWASFAVKSWPQSFFGQKFACQILPASSRRAPELRLCMAEGTLTHTVWPKPDALLWGAYETAWPLPGCITERHYQAALPSCIARLHYEEPNCQAALWRGALRSRLCSPACTEVPQWTLAERVFAVSQHGPPAVPSLFGQSGRRKSCLQKLPPNAACQSCLPMQPANAACNAPYKSSIQCRVYTAFHAAD